MKEPDPKALREVVERAKSGDKDAFAVLYKVYFTPLYRYIYYRVSEASLAEDLTQDVFMKAYGAFSRYSYSGISPLAYFYTIARNTIIDHRRKKHLIIAEEDELLAVSDTSPGPQEEAMQAESGEAIRLIISQLSEDQQDVVVLRFIEGRSTKEIAELLGKTEEAVRKLQSRALHIVKKKISHE